MKKNYDETSVIENELNELETQSSVEGLATLSKKVKESVVKVDRPQLRFIVDSYYQAQQDRITKFNQLRAVAQGADDGDKDSMLALEWLAENRKNEEAQIKKLLDEYTMSTPVGRWIRATVGIGPVLAAAFLAYFDIDRCQYAGQFLNYAGLNDKNNPWLGTDKGKKIVDFVYAVYDAQMKIYVKVLREAAGSKYDKLVDTLKKSLKKMKGIDMDTIGSLLQTDPLSDQFDGIYEALNIEEQKVYQKLNVFRDVFERFKEIFKDTTSSYYREEFSSRMETILDMVKSQGSIYSQYEELDEMLDKETGEFIYIDEDKVLPFYLNNTYRAVENTELDCKYSDQKFSNLLVYLVRPNAVTSGNMELLSVFLGRNYSSVSKGMRNMKKKDPDQLLTKTDMVKYTAKPPYNMDLKVICHLLGESFCKVSGRNSLYGRLYKERKAYELKKNAEGAYSGQALNALISKTFDKSTVTYESYSHGRLSAGHIEARARRWAVRVFIVHLFEIMYMDRHHAPAPMFYPLVHMGDQHKDYIKPENPYSDYINVPKGWYEQFRENGINTISSMKDRYGLSDMD